MRQGRDGLALDRYPVLIDFTVECLAKDDFILEGFVCRYMGFVAIVEPKVQAIEKVKASQVDDCRFIRALLCTKENRGGKDTLESLDHAVIMRLAWISAAEHVLDAYKAWGTQAFNALFDRRGRVEPGCGLRPDSGIWSRFGFGE